MIAGTIGLALLGLLLLVVVFTLLGAPYVTKNVPVPIVQSAYVTALGVVAAALVLAMAGLVALSAVVGS